MNNFVREWQEKIGIEQDGVFGRNTLQSSLDFIEGKPVKSDEPNKSAMLTQPVIAKVKLPQVNITRLVDEIIWHCAATPEGRNFTVDQVRSWHVQRGWSDIGYHFYIDLYGVIWVGRDINSKGAHVKDRNARTIGLCYCGGVTSDGERAKDTRTPKQINSGIALTQYLAAQAPIKTISGHNQYASKACPSFKIANDSWGNIEGFSQGVRQVA